MTVASQDKSMWTRVSPDGKSMHGAIGMKPGAGDGPQAYDEYGRYLGNRTLYAASGRTRTDAGGGHRPSPLGSAKRGKEMGKRYVLPPNVAEENKRITLVYSQKDGTLLDLEDRLVGKGYSGAPGHVNVPDSQGKKGLGVIPEGSWTIGEVIWDKHETRGKGENLIHLEPDAATADRERAMGRDPNSFFIHAGKKDPNDRSASQGCIIMNGNERGALRELQGAIIRVLR